MNNTPASAQLDQANSATPIRLAHFSDIHLTARPLGWGLPDWLNKRLTGWFNLRFLGRGHRFHQADEVLAALMADIRERRPDRLIFSGDATNLGFETEMGRAATVLAVTDPASPPGLAVPGNHDYYTRSAEVSGLFERYFAPWLAGERVDGATYPFAQRAGPLWLVGVNSSVGNRWPSDATGRVGTAQLERLRRLLAQLGPGRRILVTHFPYCCADGQPENRRHLLHDRAELLAVAAAGGVCLWLHGHRHGAYHLTDPGLVPLPIICAGSATQTGFWGYNEYQIAGNRCRTQRRVFDPETGKYREQEQFDVELPV